MELSPAWPAGQSNDYLNSEYNENSMGASYEAQADVSECRAAESAPRYDGGAEARRGETPWASASCRSMPSRTDRSPATRRPSASCPPSATKRGCSSWRG